MNNLAVLWNFTAFHESVMEVEYGPQWYRKIGNGAHPEAVDVRAIMDYAGEHGTVTTNIAYGDWQNLSAYATVLRECGVKLLQLFPQPRGRQDAVSDELIRGGKELMAAPDAPQKVLVVGGNNNLLPLNETVRENGGKVYTVSIATTQDREWENSADLFIDYRTIARPMQGDQENFKNPEETHEVLIRTFLDLRAQYGHDWVRQVKIKPVLLRHMGDFKETDYGYSSFGAYLGDQRTILDRRQSAKAREAEYALLEEAVPEEMREALADDAGNARSLVPYYLRIAAQQGVRMPPPEVMWIGIDIYASFLESDQIFESFGELDEECLHQLKQDIPDATLTDAKKVRQVLFKCYLFRPSKDGTIGFQEKVKTLADIEDSYFRLMLARIGNNVKEPINYTAMSLALTGEEQSADFLERLHKDL